MKGVVSGSAVCLAPDNGREWDIICSVWRGTGVSVFAGGRGRLWMDRVEDEVLVRRVASGDERALAGLYDRYAGLVYGTGMRYLGDRGTAEELVQDVFTSVWKNAAGFDPPLASFHRTSTWPPRSRGSTRSTGRCSSSLTSTASRSVRSPTAPLRLWVR